LALSFLWGVAPAILASIILEQVFHIPFNAFLGFAPGGINKFEATVLAPVIEEGIKFIGLAGVFWAAKIEIDGPLDGIIYAAMIGFGFAATENSLYLLTSVNVPEFIFLLFLRAMVFGSAHAMFTSFSGLGMALSKYTKSKWKAAWRILGCYLLAVFFHAVHNYGLILESSDWHAVVFGVLANVLGGVFIVMLFVGSLMRERQSIKRFLYPYVQSGLITSLQWEIACSITGRLRSEWKALGSMDVHQYRKIAKFYSLCAELAFKERQWNLLGPDSMLESRLKLLRNEIAIISPHLDHPSESALV
jgi:RsiW-degrading membrane proteinase PrsW (M82 family)